MESCVCVSMFVLVELGKTVNLDWEGSFFFEILFVFNIAQ